MDDEYKHEWIFKINKNGYYQYGVWDYHNDCEIALNKSISRLEKSYNCNVSQTSSNCKFVSILLDMKARRWGCRSFNDDKKIFDSNNSIVINTDKLTKLKAIPCGQIRQFSIVVSIAGKGDVIELMKYRRYL